jgi:N-acetyl-gamma-glutamyl-phosphate reductase
MASSFGVGIIGARGYTGKELMGLLEKHSALKVEMAVSARDNVTPDDVAAKKLDAYVLALPNGACQPYVDAIVKARPDAIIVDLSADKRFDDNWVYGQPERNRARIAKARHISNPGCYATAMQLAIAPLEPWLAGPVNAFGVSGYSGAGTTPSPKNDPEVLKDNLYPYSLVNHMHEREVSHQLGISLHFMPHVAPFFRGIMCTTSYVFSEPHTSDEIAAAYERAYAGEPLIILKKDAPLVRDIMNHHRVEIGGITVAADGKHAVVVSTVDNLLGGAATPALRSLNLAFGLPELEAIDAAAH